MNVRIKWLEIASASDKMYLNDLVEFTSVSFEFKTRVNAMASLKKLNYFGPIKAYNTTETLTISSP